MALTFKKIGKQINDFLKPKEYQLNRTAKICVGSDKVDWTLENKLNKEGAIESELNVSHRFEKDTLSLTTSTQKAPKFEIDTKRFDSKFKLKANVQDPVVEANLCHRRPKYAVCLDAKYDWSNANVNGEFAVSYAGIDKILLGTKVKVEQSQKNPAFGVVDYNVGLQFNRNEDQTFAVTTEDQLQKVKVGAEFQVRDSYRGFAQVSYDTNAKDDADSMGYAVGLQQNISKTASMRGVFRKNMTASVLYSNNFTDSNVCAKVAANFDFTKDPAQRASVEWKVVFGAGKPSCCS